MALEPGQQIELRVTPDPYVTVRYAGASGDFNPIHIDEQFAQQVGLPGRILHGLWTMAQVARALTDAAGGPDRLERLSVQFRGIGRIGEEIVVSGVVEGVSDRIAHVAAEAVQGENRIVRNAEADLRVRIAPGSGAHVETQRDH
jgi:acyl dehydratase